jgi:hypothetical protein
MRGVQGSSKRRLRLLLLLLLLPSSLVHVSVTEGATVNVPLHLIWTVHDPLPPLDTSPALCLTREWHLR